MDTWVKIGAGYYTFGLYTVRRHYRGWVVLNRLEEAPADSPHATVFPTLRQAKSYVEQEVAQ
jgi:hypothetical protein